MLPEHKSSKNLCLVASSGLPCYNPHMSRQFLLAHVTPLPWPWPQNYLAFEVECTVVYNGYRRWCRKLGTIHDSKQKFWAVMQVLFPHVAIVIRMEPSYKLGEEVIPGFHKVRGKALRYFQGVHYVSG